jgi:hypothetical protein
MTARPAHVVRRENCAALKAAIAAGDHARVAELRRDLSRDWSNENGRDLHDFAARKLAENTSFAR